MLEKALLEIRRGVSGRSGQAMAHSQELDAFLNSHREVIAAFDFFTVPTLTFRLQSPAAGLQPD
ncbi:MAG: hypothetical protein DMG57_23475 [Acidobacteria bacterium]|nr:MAG: hypothetical protein DMG57_23475 [Acidobacteriota bacterium]